MINEIIYNQQKRKLEKHLNYFDKKINSYSNTLAKFKTKIKKNYIDKSNKQLEYTINNLLGYKRDNKPVFNVDNYIQYFKLKDINKPITANNIKIEDNEGIFLKDKDRKQVNKLYSVVNAIEYNNKNKLSVFITFTNPSKYHYFSYGKLNSNCKSKTLEENIENSIINIKKIQRWFYNELKKRLKRKNRDVKFDYYQIIEFHKSDLSAHIHSNLFIDKKDLVIVKHIYKRTIKYFNLEQTKLTTNKDKKGRKRQSSKTYIMKYLLKMFYSKDNFYIEYKKYFNKYRLFTTSRLSKTLKEIDFVYKYLYKTDPKQLQQLKKEKIPLFNSLIEYIDKNIKFEYKTQIKEFDNLQEIYKEIENDLLTFKTLCSIANLSIFDYEDYTSYIYYKNIKSLQQNQNNYLISVKVKTINIVRLKKEQ